MRKIDRVIIEKRSFEAGRLDVTSAMEKRRREGEMEKDKKKEEKKTYKKRYKNEEKIKENINFHFL